MNKKNITSKDVKNEYKVIPLSRLKEGVPVLGVSEYHSKSFADFHLVEYVLVPLDGSWEETLTPQPPTK